MSFALIKIVKLLFILILKFYPTLHKKSPYLELFWSAFFPHFPGLKNADQNNSEYGQFLRSVKKWSSKVLILKKSKEKKRLFRITRSILCKALYGDVKFVNNESNINIRESLAAVYLGFLEKRSLKMLCYNFKNVSICLEFAFHFSQCVFRSSF